MTEKQAIWKSILHWRRMIKWVEGQDETSFVDSEKMQNSIGEWWGCLHCALCERHHLEDCVGCPLDEAGKNCNDFGSVWERVDSAEDWHGWLKAANEMLKQLESLRKPKGK